MTNEQKAKEIALSNDIYDTTEVYQSDVVDMLMEMAQWKDEQELQFLQSLIFQSSSQNIFDMINERAKLLKGEY